MSDFYIDWHQVIKISIIIVVAFILSRVVKMLMNKFITRSSELLKIDKTRYRFFRNAINAMIYIMAFIMIIHTIPSLRSISTALFASAGIFAAVLGFASQQAVSNIISGIFVVIFRPFRVGDNIKVGADLSGTVEDITLRHTVIKDSENARIIIPNSIINSQTVINYDIIDNRFCKRFVINISPRADIDKAMHILREEIYNHPNLLRYKYPGGMDDIAVHVINLTDSALTIRAYAWCENQSKATDLQNDLYKTIVHRFEKEDIQMSEPQTFLMANGKQ